MERLLDENVPVDLSLLDHVSRMCTSKNIEEAQHANDFLMEFYSRQDLYTFAVDLLNSGYATCTKFFFLSQFVKFVANNWDNIPDDYLEPLRLCIFHYLEKSHEEEPDRSIIRQAEAVLVEIMKYNFPDIWSNFFQDFFNAASLGEYQCFSCLEFLYSFLRIIMIDQDNSFTSYRAGLIIQQIDEDMNSIYNFIENVMSNSSNLEILKMALSCLSILIKRIQPASIYQSDSFTNICNIYTQNVDLTISATEVLAELMGSITQFQEYTQFAFQLFITIITSLYPIIGDSGITNAQVPESFFGSFVSSLSKFWVSLPPNLDNSENREHIVQALNWIIEITDWANDCCLLETCFDFWIPILQKLMFESHLHGVPSDTLYSQYTDPLRRILIRKMPRPYDVNQIIDEYGITIRQFQSNQQCEGFYPVARECIVFLTNISSEDTVMAFQERIQDFEKLPIESIVQLTWAIGAAASGAISQDIENREFPTLLMSLFDICSQIQSIDEKIQVVCGIVFICSQATSFFNQAHQVLDAIVRKIISFILEGNTDIQDVSISALKNLSQRCKPAFTDNKPDNLLSYLLNNVSAIFRSLTDDGILEMFKVYAILIRSIDNDELQQNCLKQLIDGLDEQWNEITSQFDPYNINHCHTLTIILRCHSAIILMLPNPYTHVLKERLPVLQLLFSILSTSTDEAAKQNDADHLNMMRAAKASIILLVHNFCYYSFHQEVILEEILPNVLSIFLNDYTLSVPNARVQETLRFFQVIFNRYAGSIQGNLQEIFTALSSATIPMIMGSFDPYIEFRQQFYSLISSVIRSFSSKMIEFPGEELNNLIEVVKWGCQHPQQAICEQSFQILSDIFVTMSRSMPPASYMEFIDHYAIPITSFLFQMITDMSYKFAFTTQVHVLKTIFTIPHIKRKQIEIFDSLCSEFPTQPPFVIAVVIEHLLDESLTYSIVKDCLKTFLIQVRQVSPLDPDLLIEEKNMMLQRMKELMNAINGMKPVDFDEREEMPDHLKNANVTKELAQKINDYSID